MNGEYVRRLLKSMDMNVNQASKILNMSSQKLYKKLKSKYLNLCFLEELSEKIDPCFFTNLPLFQKYRHLKSKTGNNVIDINNNLKINSENNNNRPESNEKEKYKLEIKHLKEEIELQKEIIALQKKMLKNQ